ncbi:hypothetical protein DMC30DRAFT_400696 [Rhodotorula diobovata]|uniref:Uncharacterized protein n=1 Tax=Rhodotorula diobovata TaxID=5288 RepID=A0A5C5FSX0_9BASI|nr:hypothetical protein DMC30DRAFT_400696 [Rhodotorula diobovata]
MLRRDRGGPACDFIGRSPSCPPPTLPPLPTDPTRQQEGAKVFAIAYPEPHRTHLTFREPSSAGGAAGSDAHCSQRLLDRSWPKSEAERLSQSCIAPQTCTSHRHAREEPQPIALRHFRSHRSPELAEPDAGLVLEVHGGLLDVAARPKVTADLLPPPDQPPAGALNDHSAAPPPPSSCVPTTSHLRLGRRLIAESLSGRDTAARRAFSLLHAACAAVTPEHTCASHLSARPAAALAPPSLSFPHFARALFSLSTPRLFDNDHPGTTS